MGSLLLLKVSGFQVGAREASSVPRMETSGHHGRGGHDGLSSSHGGGGTCGGGGGGGGGSGGGFVGG